MITQFFNELDYVIEKAKDVKYFNLLAVIREPMTPRFQSINGFEFVGYDLIEIDGNISALTNCGGFDESFLPKDLNEFGLVTQFERVKEIQRDLRKNNPNEPHANCYLYEVWRHETIGRRNLGVFNYPKKLH